MGATPNAQPSMLRVILEVLDDNKGDWTPSVGFAERVQDRGITAEKAEILRTLQILSHKLQRDVEVAKDGSIHEIDLRMVERSGTTSGSMYRLSPLGQARLEDIRALLIGSGRAV